MAVAIYSAITEKPIDNMLAMTGEVSIRGEVKPVGGVPAKLEAAARAGLKRILIPSANWQDSFGGLDLDIIKVSRIEEVVGHALVEEHESGGAKAAPGCDRLIASPFK